MAEPAVGVSADDLLLGRERELTVLSALVEESLRGVGGIAWLDGEAGIGKTSLVATVAARARERGFRVLSARAEEPDSHRPFGVVADCLGAERRSPDERGARIAGALSATPRTASDRPAEGGQLEYGRSEQLLGLVEEACARSPVMLVLDDLQWADTSSLTFVDRLSREIVGLPLVVVGAARLLPRRTELERLVAGLVARGGMRLELGPLDQATCEALAARLTGGKPGPSVSERVAACGGNPLFVSELVAALAKEGSLAIDSNGRAEVASGEVPSTLALTVLARLSFLAIEVVEVLGLASVLGSSFSVADLSLLSARPVAVLWGPLREAMAAGVLEERGDRLAFRHDVLREALYGDLPQAVRSGLHLDLGRALAATGSDPGVVAEHFVRGARRGDREAVEWLGRAAHEAAPRGAQAAAELLEAALEVAAPDDPSRGRLTAELALNLVAARRQRRGRSSADERSRTGSTRSSRECCGCASLTRCSDAASSSRPSPRPSERRSRVASPTPSAPLRWPGRRSPRCSCAISRPRRWPPSGRWRRPSGPA